MLFDFSDRDFFFDPFSMHFFASPPNPVPALTKQDSTPGYGSRLLHEITHLDCMRTDLGTALLIGMLWLRNRFGAIGETHPVQTSDGETLLHPSTGKPMLARPLLVRKVLYAFGEATPILEGLAMFAQLDLKFSSEEVSGLHFRAVLSLISQTSQTSGESLLSQVSRYHDDVRRYSISEDRLLHRLLFAVDRRNSYYLFGYIYIKSLAFILREKDRRFQDAEMAYLFLRAFLMNGAAYIDEGCPSMGSVGRELRGRLAMLRACPSKGVQLAYDLLLKDSDKLTGVDWAHFLTSGKLRCATEEGRLRAALAGAEVEHDGLMSVLISLDFVPLKMVVGSIAAATVNGDHVQMSIVSRDNEKVANTVKWITRDDFSLVENRGAEAGRVVPMVPEFPTPENSLKAPEDPRAITILWTNVFLAESLTPVNLWSSPGAVFSDDGSNWTRLRGPESAYLNFFERRHFADFIFDVIGSQLPGVGGAIHDFNLFVFQNLMKIKGGRQFERLLDHGFSIATDANVSFVDDQNQNLSATTREQINRLLTYPIFE